MGLGLAHGTNGAILATLLLGGEFCVDTEGTKVLDCTTAGTKAVVGWNVGGGRL